MSSLEQLVQSFRQVLELAPESGEGTFDATAHMVPRDRGLPDTILIS